MTLSKNRSRRTRFILIAERALETSNLKREVSDLKQRSGETSD